MKLKQGQLLSILLLLTVIGISFYQGMHEPLAEPKRLPALVETKKAVSIEKGEIDFSKSFLVKAEVQEPKGAVSANKTAGKQQMQAESAQRTEFAKQGDSAKKDAQTEQKKTAGQTKALNKKYKYLGSVKNNSTITYYLKNIDTMQLVKTETLKQYEGEIL
ncbi:MAG: hypothetical protein LBM77_11710 [Spirochaetaceae bacterium]|jgi:hypothetical protein|nr:hypothetical protein [Spirochaetaceae bacterium]